MGAEEEIVDAINKELPGKADASIKRQRRIFIKVSRGDLKNAVEVLADKLKVKHLSTITARDTGTDFEILYHFFTRGVVVTVRTACPRDDPSVDSIMKIFPGAVFYEREIHDLFGVEPRGHIDLRRLVLPEDWDQGYPLRKDWKPKGGESVGKG
jgi:NADH:ubiquinone oxidoreductase subunit C